MNNIFVKVIICLLEILIIFSKEYQAQCKLDYLKGIHSINTFADLKLNVPMVKRKKYDLQI